MKNRDKDTEEIILRAARKIFVSKGYYGTRMQDIADEAEINKAMLHYYFRNKDKLFQKIFSELFTKLIQNVQSILSGDHPFDKKIEYFVKSYIETIEDNPFIPAFILHELNHNLERLETFINDISINMSPVFIEDLKMEMKKGNIKTANPSIFFINIVSLCIFPFVAKPLISRIFNYDEDKFKEYNEERKEILADLILHGMKSR